MIFFFRRDKIFVWGAVTGQLAFSERRHPLVEIGNEIPLSKMFCYFYVRGAEESKPIELCLSFLN